MIPSLTRKIASMFASASGFSILAMIPGHPVPTSSTRACNSSTSLARRTNESASRSTPSASAKCASTRSCSVSDGADTATAGRFIPLRSVRREGVPVDRLSPALAEAGVWVLTLRSGNQARRSPTCG